LSSYAGQAIELRFTANGGSATAQTTLLVDAVSAIASPDGVGTAAACLTGGNVMMLDGRGGDYVHPTLETITGGAWSMQINPSTTTGPGAIYLGNTSNGINWNATVGLDPLVAGAIGEGATQSTSYQFGPTLMVGGSTRGCGVTSGRWQVQELVVDYTQIPEGVLRRLTATFEQSCEDEYPVLRGCMHFEQ
jgi:hypothetical protein